MEVSEFLTITGQAIAELSSNMIKGLTGPTGWEETVRRYVPGPVFEALAARGGTL